jgi:hypothetical protein
MAEASSFLPIELIVEDWGELIGSLYLVCFVWVRGFWGLTRDFGWKNAKNILEGCDLRSRCGFCRFRFLGMGERLAGNA